MEDELGMELFDLDFENLDLEEETTEETDDNSVQDDNDNKDPGEGESPEDVAEEDETDDEDTTDDTSDDSPDLFKSLVTVLADEGVLTEVDSEVEIKSVTDVIDLVKKEINRQELSDLTDLQKEALEAYRAGISVERFNKQIEVQERLDGIDDEAINNDENLRKQLIFQEYKSNGYSDEKALRLTKRSFDAEEDVEDAKSALATLKQNLKQKYLDEKNALKEAQKEKAASERKKQDDIKKRVFSTDEVFKGYKVNEGLKKKIYSEIYNPTNTNPDTGRKENNLMKYQRENPEEFMHKLYFLWSATKGFQDFEYFATRERSKGVRDLEDALRKSSHVRSGGDSNFLDDAESFSFDIGDELVID